LRRTAARSNTIGDMGCSAAELMSFARAPVKAEERR
jgi:hypothetical protein